VEVRSSFSLDNFNLSDNSRPDQGPNNIKMKDLQDILCSMIIYQVE